MKEARRAKEKKDQRDRRRKQQDDPVYASALMKPSLAEEIQLFKAIVRHIDT